MAHEPDTISVVITCYAEGALLEEAVESALGQTRAPLEVIIVNDASKDATTNRLCEELAARDGISVVWRERNGGPSAAREDGFRAAHGEIFVPLDADDLLPKGALAAIGAAFDAHDDAGLVYGDYRREDRAGAGEAVVVGEVTLGEMLRSRRFSPGSRWKLLGTTPLRRALWQAAGSCDPSFGVDDLHDVEFLIRALTTPGFAAYYVPQEIYVWRKYLGSNTRRVTPLSWSRIARKHFAVYAEHGLQARAYELLLLGSKYSKDRAEQRRHAAELRRCILRGEFNLQTLAIWLLPATLLRPAARLLAKRR